MMIKINMPQEVIDIHKIYAKQIIEKKAFKIYNNPDISTTDKIHLKEYLDIKIDDNETNILSSRITDICTTKDLKSEIVKFNELNIDKPENFIKLLKQIFNYDNFCNNKNCIEVKGEKINWNRHEFLNKLDVNVCPYCNREYISNYYNETEKEFKSTGTVDHYYTKADYPYLAVSIYNLIPSCTVCNSYMKGKSSSEHLYPYKDESDSLIFKTKLDTVENLYNFSSENIEIEIVNNPNRNIEKSENSKSVFNLIPIYQNHKDDIFILKNKIKNYLEFTSIENYISNEYGSELGEKLEKIDFNENWFPFLGTQFSDAPLTKMKTDIYNQIIGDLK